MLLHGCWQAKHHSLMLWWSFFLNSWRASFAFPHLSLSYLRVLLVVILEETLTVEINIKNFRLRAIVACLLAHIRIKSWKHTFFLGLQLILEGLGILILLQVFKIADLRKWMLHWLFDFNIHERSFNASY